MAETIEQRVTRIKNDIVSFRDLDESSIKQAVVLNLLSLAGWNPFDPSELVPEYTVGNRRVDFALNPNSTNTVFIEVKRPGANLAYHSQQLLEYCFQEGVKLSVLTNGLSWWLYLPLQGGSWQQRRFLTIDLESQEAEIVHQQFAKYLAKENVSNGKAVSDAEDLVESQRRAEIASATIIQAWNQIIGTPDEILVDLISETAEHITGFKLDAELVKEFLSRRVHTLSNEVNENPRPVTDPEPLIKPIQPVSRDRTLPIILVPQNSTDFKAVLLQRKEAWIETTYNDGRKEVKRWDASRMRPSSDVIRNLRSRPEYRQGAWQRKGIIGVRVSIERPRSEDR